MIEHSRKHLNFHRHTQIEHSKHYDTLADEVHHFRIFIDNKYKIAEHNLHDNNGVASFKMSLNKYSDLSSDEFFETMNGYNSDEE